MPVKNIVTGQYVSEYKLERARELRRDMPPAEKILWEELRRNKLGAHFRRQQVIEGFIVDFYCHSASLVIEVDGSIHNEPEQKKYDIERENILKEMGLKIIHFWNEEVFKNLPAVLNRIQELLNT